MKIIKKTILAIVAILLLFISYLLYNTLTFKSKQVSFDATEVIGIDPISKINFSNAIKIKTISPENAADFDSLQFNNFNSFLSKTYPFVDSLLTHKTFNNYSHLYKWE
jgi:carboxypeptidase PM20D1